MAIDGCIEDDILADLLRKERARVRNILLEDLTEEEREQLYEMQRERDVEEGIEKGRKEGKLEAVSVIVAGGLCDAEKACEIIGIPYDKYLESRSK